MLVYAWKKTDISDLSVTPYSVNRTEDAVNISNIPLSPLDVTDKGEVQPTASLLTRCSIEANPHNIKNGYWRSPVE